MKTSKTLLIAALAALLLALCAGCSVTHSATYWEDGTLKSESHSSECAVTAHFNINIDTTGWFGGGWFAVPIWGRKPHWYWRAPK